MNKMLVICGPTAVGKTKLGVKLARKFGGEIVSADSRQVYRGMDIGTGKDFSEYGEIKAWGLDLIEANESFDASEYVRYGRGVVEDVLGRGKLPIVVGGTGFYIKALVDGIESMNIKPDRKLRKRLAGMETGDLYNELLEVDKKRAEGMNESDRMNPRRLVRAIEVASAREFEEEDQFKGALKKYDVLKIGLEMGREKLNQKIEKRVDARMKEGMVEEIKRLLEDGVTWENQSMQGLGYKQLKGYFNGECGLSEAVEEWKKEEQRYAKRQMTWFKKDEWISWFDVTQDGFEKKVEEFSEKWYKFK